MMRTIGKTYLHVGNSGATFSVVDGGHGPTIEVATSSFGNLKNTLLVHTNLDGLRAIRNMLDDAIGYEGGWSQGYCNPATPCPLINDPVNDEHHSTEMHPAEPCTPDMYLQKETTIHDMMSNVKDMHKHGMSWDAIGYHVGVNASTIAAMYEAYNRTNKV